MTGLEVALALKIVAASAVIIDKSVKFANHIQIKQSNKIANTGKKSFWDFFKPINSNNNAELIEEIRAIKNFVDELNNSIEYGVNQIIQKIEADKKEELASRIRNLSLLLKLNNDERVLSELMNLNVCVDYASNRLNEGKREWLIPYLLGQSAKIAAYSFLRYEHSSLISEMDSVIERIKLEVIDKYVEILYRKNIKVPWDGISYLLENKPITNPKYIQYLVSLIPDENYDVIGHWVMEMKWVDGQTTGGTVYIKNRGEGYYATLILTYHPPNGESHIVQQHANISVHKSEVSIRAYDYHRISGTINGWNLENWKGSFINPETITGKFNDGKKSGTFKLRK